jgi:SAM-dependent methyltransferase
MNQQLINNLSFYIKEKKELSGLADFIVQDALKLYLKKNKIEKHNFSEKEEKIIIKEVRNNLRKMAGRFQKDSEEYYLSDKIDINSILSKHTSTKERLEYYPLLREKINSLNIKSILDLGCGLNPIALASSSLKYYALDINEADLEIVRKYFMLKKIPGNVFTYDLRNINNSLPKSDLCLIFKVFDVIETRGHKLAEKIIKTVDCNFFLISFSTKTLSGKPMNHPQRGWIEQLLKRLNYKYESFKTKNEIFYLIKKS